VGRCPGRALKARGTTGAEGSSVAKASTKRALADERPEEGSEGLRNSPEFPESGNNMDKMEGGFVEGKGEKRRAPIQAATRAGKDAVFDGDWGRELSRKKRLVTIGRGWKHR